MCEDFIFSIVGPLFAFLFNIFALFSGDITSNQAESLALEVKKRTNCSDLEQRAIFRIALSQRKGADVFSALAATVLSYLTSLFAVGRAFELSGVIGFVLVVVPVLVLVFSLYLTVSIGVSNLFTHYIISPLRNVTGKPTIPLTYGGLVSLLNISICVLLFSVLYLVQNGSSCVQWLDWQSAD